ncbi:MAG TPA: aldo/keto reductase [Bryobacteraceae bacterium]|nr:aldo/keto reductase [Bryobacteraceae bacterium]
MSISRRGFLGAAAASVAAHASSPMPKRVLGRTGAHVSILAFGCGSRFLMYKEEDEALKALNHALDLGITYVDTAYAYGDGLSETRVGKVMKTRRKEVWLATKVPDRKDDEAMRRIEGSLKRLQTDHLDLIHIHSLGGADDLAAIEAKDGVLTTLHRLRDQKVTRAIGITCHTDPSVLKTALERHDFDCTQMALNGAQAGMAHLDHDPGGSFETLALPVAKRKNLGVIAMKIFAQEKLSGKAQPETLIRYSLSLPVSAAVIGMPKIGFIEQNIATAKAFQPMTPAEMRSVANELTGAYRVSIERSSAGHVDA